MREQKLEYGGGAISSLQDEVISFEMRRVARLQGRVKEMWGGMLVVDVSAMLISLGCDTPRGTRSFLRDRNKNGR